MMSDGNKRARGDGEPIVWGGYTQTELNAQYDQTTIVKDMPAINASLLEDSARVRSDMSSRCVLDIPYGPTTLEKLDVFLADEPNGPVVVFHHGGAWTRSSKEYHSYLAPPFVSKGINVVVLGFALAPKVSLDEIVRQNRAGIAWVYANASTHGWDRSRIHSVGHSSGGHICGMMLVTEWAEAYGLPADVIKSAAPCSGVFDLAPVKLSARNSYLDLTERAVARNSPIRQIPEATAARTIPLTIAWGSGELDEFQRQCREFAAAYRAAGHPVRTFIREDVTHFKVSQVRFDPSPAHGALCADPSAAGAPAHRASIPLLSGREGYV